VVEIVLAKLGQPYGSSDAYMCIVMSQERPQAHDNRRLTISTERLNDILLDSWIMLMIEGGATHLGRFAGGGTGWMHWLALAVGFAGAALIGTGRLRRASNTPTPAG
jgi:hypothetical protein